MYEDKMKVLNHYQESIDWVNSLRKLSEENWRTPIEVGKWTIAEVIGHLIPWDEFVLNQRIPYLFSTEELPDSPDTEFVNQQAAKLSREWSKDKTINLFMDRRNSLIRSLSDLPEELWTQEVHINRNNLSLVHYFAGLIEHDDHHFNQIQNVL